jgi:hypothetical protein
VVNLRSPSERFFGILLDLSVAGATVRGVDLNAFDDWMNHINGKEESGVQPTTIFFPLHRIEKIILDEGIGAIPSLAATFLTRVGSSVQEYLEL